MYCKKLQSGSCKEQQKEGTEMNDTNSLSHANITPLLKKLNQFHQMIQTELNEMNLWTYVIRQDTAGLLCILFAPKCRTKDTGKTCEQVVTGIRHKQRFVRIVLHRLVERPSKVSISSAMGILQGDKQQVEILSQMSFCRQYKALSAWQIPLGFVGNIY